MDVPSELHAIDDLLAHSSWLSSLALRLLRDVADAEEFVQETWLKALAKPPVKSVPIRPWLTRVLRNTVAEKRRAGARRRHREERGAREEALSSTMEMAESVESQRLLAELVLQLEEPYKSAVMWRYYEGLSAAEIARRTDIPAGTIRWRLSEGLNQLKSELDRRHGGDRIAWCKALAPLAGVDRTAAASTAGTFALTLGVLTMKPVLIVAAILVSVLVYTLGSSPFGMSRSDRGSALERSVVAVDREDLDESEETPGIVRRESIGGTVEDPGAALVASTNAFLVGRVVDESRRPIVGAELSATVAYGDDQVSDSEGHFGFTFDHLRYAGNGTLTVAAAGFARERLDFEMTSGTIDLGEIMLVPGGTIAGQVQDEAGLGLSDAAVFAMPHTNQRSPFAKKSQHEALSFTRTDAKGRFVLTGVRPGYVDVWAQKTAKLSSWADGVTVEARTETTGVEITLLEIPDDAVISGIVLDPTGAPVPMANVAITRHEEFGVWTQSTSSDRDGRFRLEKQIDGPVTLDATAHEFPHFHAVAPSVEPGTREVVLKLTEPTWIEIVARDEDGRGVHVDRVQIASRHSSEMGGRTTSTAKLREEKDSISIACPVQRFTLVVEKAGFHSVEIGPLEPDTVGDRIDVLFDRLPVLTGIVTAAGEPVEGAEVVLHSIVPRGYEFVREQFPLLWRDVEDHTTTTDADGRFRLAIDEDEIDDSEYVLRADADGFAASMTHAFTLDGSRQPKDLEIELDAGGTIEGHVELPDGAAPAGTVVGASNGDGEIHARRVGADGAFRFEHLTPGTWLVQRMDSERGFGTGTLGGTSPAAVTEPIAWSCRVRQGEVTTFDLDLRRPSTARLTGRLTIDGAGPGPWTVSITAPFERSLLIRSQVPRGTALRPDGSFELENVPVGEYTLIIRNGDYDKTYLSQKLTLVRGDQPWNLDLNFAPLAGRIDRELIGDRLIHVHETPDGIRVSTPIDIDESGAFSSRVPTGLGFLHDAKGWNTQAAPVLLEIDLATSGMTAIELK